MTPRIVTEPITGLGFVATRPAHVWLAWLPCIVAMAAFGLGWFVGRWW